MGKTCEVFFSNRWVQLQQEISCVLQCCSRWEVVVLFGASALILSSIPLWTFTHKLKLSIICLSCREKAPQCQQSHCFPGWPSWHSSVPQNQPSQHVMGQLGNLGKFISDPLETLCPKCLRDHGQFMTVYKGVLWAVQGTLSARSIESLLVVRSK